MDLPDHSVIPPFPMTRSSRKKAKKVAYHVLNVDDAPEASLSMVYDVANPRRLKKTDAVSVIEPPRLESPSEDPRSEPTHPVQHPPSPSSHPLDSLAWESDSPPSSISDEVPGITVIVKPKATRYDTTVSRHATATIPNNAYALQAAPLAVWLPHRDEYLREYCWHDGRGAAPAVCPRCQEGPPVARCEERCLDEPLCVRCMVKAHARQPLHFLQVRPGAMWLLVCHQCFAADLAERLLLSFIIAVLGIVLAARAPRT